MINPYLLNKSLNHIDLNDAEGFKNIFHTLSANKEFDVAANLAKQLLKDRTPELFQSTPFRERYEFILQNLKEVYPFLNPYFARMGGNGLHNSAISTKGQKVVISQMPAKKNVQACESYAHFKPKFKNFCKKNPPQQQTFLLRHRDNNRKFTNHTTAIHAVKERHELAVYFADSTGGINKKCERNEWAKSIISSIKQQYVESGSRTPLNIYYYNGHSRQTDHTNCVIYALRDANYMSRSSNELMKWIRGNGQPENLEANVTGVPLLPPQLMKTTQSFTAINNYLNTPLQDLDLHTLKLPSKKNPDGETLEENLSRHTGILSTPGKRIRINTKIAEAFLKFERNIIAQAIIDNANQPS